MDGEIDRLAGRTRMMPRSMIFRVSPENDDMVGELVQARIFEAGEMVYTTRAELARGSGKLLAAVS